MSDTMTSGFVPENALSEHSGADALASLRQKQDAPETEDPAPELTEEETSGEDTEDSDAAESEGDTTDSETDESDESIEADDDESEADDEESEVKITLKDGTEITGEEAAKGYLRESDYTRKMQQGRAELKDKQAELEAQHTEAMKALGNLYQELSTLRPREPDWSARVDEVGADQAMKEQQAWNRHNAALKKAQEELQNSQKQNLYKAQERAKEKLVSGELIPEWADTKAFNDGLSKVSDYLIEQGYDADILGQIADPVAISLAEKARRWDELQRVKPEAKKVAKKKPKPLKAGGRNQVPKGQDRDKQQAMNRFRQTKTQEDGLAALQRLRMSVEN